MIAKIISYFKKKSTDAVFQHSCHFKSSNKTVVFISGELPSFDKDSGSNRFKEIIQAYVDGNYNCIFTVDSIANFEKYYEYFSNIGVQIYATKKSKGNLIQYLKSIPRVDYIWFYGPNALKKKYAICKKTLPNATTIYDMVDIHFLRYQRALELYPNNNSLKRRQKKYFKIETYLARKLDYVITISDKEKEYMSQHIDVSKLVTISNVHYSKINIENVKSFEDRKDLLFVGSTHTPNIDAIYFLFNKIMPIVWNRNNEIKVNIIGNVREEINDISHPNMIFHGYVEHMEELLISSKMMIAPLRYGAGVKGKLGQALEYYLPIVSSSIGVEGMGLLHKENALIADNEENFANAILELYEDKILWQKLQKNSDKALEPFSVEQLKCKISKL